MLGHQICDIPVLKVCRWYRRLCLKQDKNHFRKLLQPDKNLHRRLHHQLQHVEKQKVHILGLMGFQMSPDQVTAVVAEAHGASRRKLVVRCPPRPASVRYLR